MAPSAGRFFPGAAPGRDPPQHAPGEEEGVGALRLQEQDVLGFVVPPAARRVHQLLAVEEGKSSSRFTQSR